MLILPRSRMIQRLDVAGGLKPNGVFAIDSGHHATPFRSRARGRIRLERATAAPGKRSSGASRSLFPTTVRPEGRSSPLTGDRGVPGGIASVPQSRLTRNRAGSASRNLRHQVDLAIRIDCREERILVYCAVDRERDAVVQMRSELRIAFTQFCKQLAHVRGVYSRLAISAGKPSKVAGEDNASHRGLLSPPRPECALRPAPSTPSAATSADR